MNNKYGNWRALDGAVISDKINDYGNFIVVNCVRERTEQDDKNILLCAAAPDLLRACELALKALEMIHEPGYDDTEIEALKNAINKALGK